LSTPPPPTPTLFPYTTLFRSYKDDRQALNRATMQLYREHKVNPMGGCLPMVLQIPVFFAFYNALLYAIELRHAPFVCWHTELWRSEEHTSELQSRGHLVCRLL